MNGETVDFSEDMVRASAEAYDPALHEAPLVVGHPKHDAPAYGWAKSLAYVGTLNAEPHQVDPAFAEMNRAGRFKKISTSFYTPDSPDNPVPGVYYVRHIGFLGAQPPAVKGLKNASFADHAEGVVEFGDWIDSQQAGMWRRMRDFIIGKFGLDEADKVIPDYEVRSIEDAARTPENKTMSAFAENIKADLAGARKWLAAAIARHKKHIDGSEPASEASQEKMMDEMESALDALGADAGKMDMSEQPTEEEKRMKEDIAAQKAALEIQQAEFAERETKLRAEEQKAARKSVLEFVETLVKAGKILPLHQAGLVEYLAAPTAESVIEFGEADARVKKPAAGWLKEFLTALPVQVDYTERARAETAAGAKPAPSVPHGYSVDAGRNELHGKALAYAEQNKTDYLTAIHAVSQ